MTDYTELKRLAEAQTNQKWTYYKGDMSMYAGEHMYMLKGPVGVSDHENWGFTRDEAAFIAAANPAAVLALIAENERVKARLCVCRDCGGQGEIYSGHSTFQGYNQPPEPDMDVCGTCGGDGVLGPVEDFEALAAERDQLKAEVEALRNGMCKIIEMNRQHAEDQYGDADKAESWGCVTVARAAMTKEQPK